MKTLSVSPDLALPADAVTQTFGILGKRGSGKTNAGRVLAEEMFARALPFVVIDPVGAWWGLRAARDGKGPGLAVPIFGGDHGDVPLDRGAGGELADLVADERLSCVLDLAALSESDKVRFLTEFAERLFTKNRDPLHLYLEEADDFIPQRVMGDRARLVGAWQRIVKRGRSRGLGATMITQRSAALHKDVLTQCETLLVFRTTAPQDLKAIQGWLQFHGQQTDVLASLPSLRDGECWVWSPHWLGRLVRVRLRLSRTYDSGATPGVAGRRAPATLADIDLGAIRQRMAAAIERAKDTDPKALRQEILRLRGELARAQAARPEPRVERVEVPVVREEMAKRLERALLQAEGVADRLRQTAQAIVEAAAQAQRALDAVRAVRPVLPSPRSADAPPRPRARPAEASGEPARRLGLAERCILTVLAQYPAGRSVRQVAVMTGYASKGGGFRNALGALRSAGLITGGGRGGDGLVRATAEGLAALGTWEPLPEPGPALVAYWREQLGRAESEILRVLEAGYPRALSLEALAAQTVSERGEPYDPQGGGFRNALGRLRTLGLIEGRGEVRLSADVVGAGMGTPGGTGGATHVS